MATWYLINGAQVAENYIYAGTLVDDVVDAATVAAIQAAGGLLVASSNAAVAVAAAIALQKRLAGADPFELDLLMSAAYQAQQQFEVLGAVADAAAVATIPAALRSNGSLVIKLDDDTIWTFDSLSAAAASDWVIVPTAGTGRWLRKDQLAGAVHAPVADNAAVQAIAATGRQDGMAVIKLDDYTVWGFAAASVEAASDWCIVPAAGNGRWIRGDQNRGAAIMPVADNAALIALTAANRRDGTRVVQLDTMQEWVYDLGSVAGASDWVVIPTDGVGRWLLVSPPDGRVLPPVADNAALIALTAADRQDGSLIVQLDTMEQWTYDLGSAAAASTWCVVPTDGVGRWLKTDDTTGATHAPVADAAALAAIAATDRVNGMTCVRLDEDTVWVFDGASAAPASSACIVPAAGLGRWLFFGEVWGVPMRNRLHLANVGLGGAAPANGIIVTIGANVFEFRDTTPPVGGTAGRIWVFSGANVAAALLNLIDAINGVIDAARITYDGALVETFLAAPGIAATDMAMTSADAPGGVPIASAVATACTTTLVDGLDDWDQATCYGGVGPGVHRRARTSFAVTAEMIQKGTVEAVFDFTPVAALSNVTDNQRVHNEAWAVVGNSLSVVLAGGAAPNIQAGDVLVFDAVS